MEITVRNFEFGKDYPEICEWWRKRGWPHVPKSHLPPTGLVSEYNGVKLCALWVYLTQSAFAIMEFYIINPDAPLKIRAKGLEKTIEMAKGLAMQAGSETIFSSLQSSGLMKVLGKQGFKKADLGMTNMIYRKGQL